jgi:predicted aconitase with swiveling domain
MSTRSLACCRRIVGGKAEGEALVSLQPINFLAMVDVKTGKITDPKHQLFGKSLKDIILVFPNAIGSSVGAYVFYSLKEAGTAPKAIICSNKADITTASGCAIANIPVVDTCLLNVVVDREEAKKKDALAESEKKESLQASMIFKQGSKIKVDADAGTIIIIATV